MSVLYVSELHLGRWWDTPDVTMIWTGIIFLTYHVLATLARSRSGVVCGSDGRTYQDAEELLLAQTKYPSVTLLYYGPCNVQNSDQSMVCGSNGITYQSIYKLMLEREIDPSLNVLYMGPCSAYKDQSQYDDTSILTPNSFVCGSDLRTYRYQHLQLAQIESPQLRVLHPGSCGLNVMPTVPYVNPGNVVGMYPNRVVGRKRVVGKNLIGRSAMGAVVSESNKEAEGAGLGNYGGSSYGHEDYSWNKQWGNTGWETQQCEQTGSCHNPGQCGIPGTPPCQNQYIGQCGGPGQPPCLNQQLILCGGPEQPPCLNLYPGHCGQPGQPPCLNVVPEQCGGTGQQSCINYYPGQCGGTGQPSCNNYYPGQCGGTGQPPCQNNYPGQCGYPGQPSCTNYPGSSQTCGFPGQSCQNSGGCKGQICFGLGAAEGGGGLGSAPEKRNDDDTVERRSSTLRQKKAKRGGTRAGRPLWEVGNKGFNLIGRSGSELGAKDLEDKRNRSKHSDDQRLPHDRQGPGFGQ